MNDSRLYSILLAPVVTEKGARAADALKQFVFKVTLNANKSEIATAVRKIFAVDVLSVRTAIVKGKARMFKQRPGKRSDWKKAYVQIKADQDIDFTKL